MFDNMVQLTLLIIMIYICVYGIVNRICKCIEYCSVGKVYKEQLKAGNDISGKDQNNV